MICIFPYFYSPLIDLMYLFSTPMLQHKTKGTTNLLIQTSNFYVHLECI